MNIPADDSFSSEPDWWPALTTDSFSLRSSFFRTGNAVGKTGRPESASGLMNRRVLFLYWNRKRVVRGHRARPYTDGSFLVPIIHEGELHGLDTNTNLITDFRQPQRDGEQSPAAADA